MKKKNRIFIYPLAIMVMILIFTNSCKKDDDNNNPPLTVIDMDGNIYHTVTIGTQVWMVENLKVTRYRNGDLIPNVNIDTTWINLTTGAYCEYDKLAGNGNIYGKLYNWYSVIDSRNIAPTGWHIPNVTEWTILTDYLGGANVAGGKLKEKGITHWSDPNIGATNETGFTALPGGSRYIDGSFLNIGSNGYWWTSSMDDITVSFYLGVHSGDIGVNKGSHNKSSGFSVRCLKDN
jgi:uncharacterized protein (TIGR02145 family)